ncbi:MAG: aminotransferase class V-fold PLP-dependent enzyme [Ignavibacteriaceae bacterium]
MFQLSNNTIDNQLREVDESINNPYPNNEEERLRQLDNLLFITKGYGMEYLEKLNTRKVYPTKENLENLKKFIEPIPENSSDPAEVLGMLHKHGSPAATASAGRRYFGFVIGGSQPAALAANWLSGVWDQNAGLEVTSPVSAAVEDVVSKWLVEILPVSKESVAGFTTGVTMANLTGLAAARHHIIKRYGWDVQERGLYGAPEIEVVTGEQAHGSLLKALSILGLGRSRVTKVPVDSQGRMRVGKFPKVNENTIVCLQAGNVNTGSFDPAEHIIPYAKAMGSWVHVDGAFGLWAGSSPEYSHLTIGYEDADSWATDAHKWLNVPYDSGIILCKNADDLKAAMSLSGDYLDQSGSRIPYQFTPELSRRARGIEIWAALKTLGKSGVAELIERTCKLAELFSLRLKNAGFSILNDVKINQVLVSFGSSERTEKIIKAIQEDGTCWCGGTIWKGETAMRISVSSWATEESDIHLCADTIISIANSIK